MKFILTILITITSLHPFAQGPTFYRQNYSFDYRGLVAWYNMDVVVGGLFDDEVGATKGTLNGSYTALDRLTAKVGRGAISFTGGYGIVPDYSPGTGDMSLSIWVYPTILSGVDHWIYASYGTGNNALVLLRLTGDKFQWYIRDVSGAEAIICTNTSTLSTNTWYHLVAVKSGTTAQLYVNDVLEASGSNGALGAVTTTGTGGGAAHIGAYALNPTQFLFTGYMDNLGIYNAALNQDRVTELFKWNLNK